MEREEQWVQCCLCPITVSDSQHQIVHFCVEVVGDMQRMQVAECRTTPGHMRLEHLSTWPGEHGRLCRNNKSINFPLVLPSVIFRCTQNWKYPSNWRLATLRRRQTRQWEVGGKSAGERTSLWRAVDQNSASQSLKTWPSAHLFVLPDTQAPGDWCWQTVLLKCVWPDLC